MSEALDDICSGFGVGDDNDSDDEADGVHEVLDGICCGFGVGDDDSDGGVDDMHEVVDATDVNDSSPENDGEGDARHEVAETVDDVREEKDDGKGPSAASADRRAATASC